MSLINPIVPDSNLLVERSQSAKAQLEKAEEIFSHFSTASETDKQLMATHLDATYKALTVDGVIPVSMLRP